MSLAADLRLEMSDLEPENLAGLITEEVGLSSGFHGAHVWRLPCSEFLTGSRNRVKVLTGKTGQSARFDRAVTYSTIEVICECSTTSGSENSRKVLNVP